jgi:hypothetical protein
MPLFSFRTESFYISRIAAHTARSTPLREYGPKIVVQHRQLTVECEPAVRGLVEASAVAFSRVTGHEVRYVQAPWHEFEAQAGRETEQMFRWFQDVGFHVNIPAVRQEYPKLTTFDSWLNSNWHSATRAA